MSRAAACGADPQVTPGIEFCPLACAAGEVEVGPRQSTEPQTWYAICGDGPADSACELYCVGDEPRVAVVPEPGFEALAFGALLCVALARC